MSGGEERGGGGCKRRGVRGGVRGGGWERGVGGGEGVAIDRPSALLPDVTHRDLPEPHSEPVFSEKQSVQRLYRCSPSPETEEKTHPKCTAESRDDSAVVQRTPEPVKGGHVLAADRRVTMKYMEVTRDTVAFHVYSAAVHGVAGPCRLQLSRAATCSLQTEVIQNSTFYSKGLEVMEILSAVRYLYHCREELATGKTVAGSMARAPAGRT